MIMNKINDYKEISPLIFKYFKRGVITNNFLTPKDYRCEISEGNFFYIADEDYLNLFVKRDNFFRLYFYVLDENVIFREIDAKIVCDIAGISETLLLNNNFIKALERVQLKYNSEKEGIASYFKAKKEDAEEVFKLMENCFDKYTGYSPNLTQLKEECEEGVIYKEVIDGRIAGVLRAGKSSKISSVKHLCVSEEFRGKGIAKKLCREFLNENTNAIVWTGKENTSAISLYKSLGFSESGLKSTVYMKG